MPRATPVSPIAVSTSPTPSVPSSTITESSPATVAGRDYGEDRYRLLGAIEGRVFVMIYTVRGSALRIISARKANRKEIREYEHHASQS